METDRADALELAKGLEATASNIERVAKKTNPDAARWAFTQWALRKRAVEKGFPKAEEMLFMREALEQASHFAVARYHASLFPLGELVADLTCGIGSDLIALAERGPVIGFDIDAERLECARHNLSVHGLEGELVLGDCLNREWNFGYAVGDPNRRVGGKRTSDHESFNPSPRALSSRMAMLRLGAIKLSPMLADRVLAIFGNHIEFVSYGGECREALVICGSEAKRAVFAIQAENGARLTSGDPIAVVDEPLCYFYEADRAAIRAHALSSVAPNRFFGLGDSNGYMTSESAIPSQWVSRYQVLDFGRFDTKALRAKLRELGGGRPIVKSRAARFDLHEATRELTTEGSSESIIAIYPVNTSLRFVILKRL